MGFHLDFTLIKIDSDILSLGSLNYFIFAKKHVAWNSSDVNKMEWFSLESGLSTLS